jgi:hypothetical protein
LDELAQSANKPENATSTKIEESGNSFPAFDEEMMERRGGMPH